MIETIIEALKNVPDLMNLFIPGFIFLTFYRYLIDDDNDKYEYTVIKSIAISYCINITFSFIDRQLIKLLVCLVVSLILPIILYFGIKKTGLLNSLLQKVTHTSEAQNIWDDTIDSHKGSYISFYMQDKEDTFRISGYVFAYVALEDSCDIAVKEYKIYHRISPENEILIHSENAKTLVVNSKNINFIEIR